MAVLYGNDAFSILVLSTKKRYSSFLKKVSVYQKIRFKVKVLKTFKISTDCYIKTLRSLKRRAILKIPSAFYRRTYALSFCWFSNETSTKKRFPVQDKNQTRFSRKNCSKEQPFIFTVYLMNHIF